MKSKSLPLLLFLPPILTTGALILQLLQVPFFASPRFDLLTLLFSLQAAFATPLLLMNRPSPRERTINTAALEKDIEQLKSQLAQLETEKLDKMIEWIGVLLKSELLRREQGEVASPRRTLR